MLNALMQERKAPATAIRTLIVEDEAANRRLLRTLLGAIEGVDVVAEAVSAPEGLQKLVELRPDLVFMDIQMPGGNGIELLRGLESPPEVVFVTGYPEYALPALEMHPSDFITKPISQKRLAECVQRVQRRLVEKRFADLALRIAGLTNAARDESRGNELLTGYPDQILIRVRRRRVWLEVADIAWVEGASQYCRVHARTGEFLLSRSLNSMEANLDPAQFFRIHRSAIVNAAHVREVRSTGDGQYCLHLGSGPPIPVGRSRRETLKRLVKRIGQRT
jgi:two-component system, LytTR family, response regulator